MNYQEYLKHKSQINNNFGFNPIFMPDFLFDFQKYIVEWNLIKGRSATFADCGLGKTPIILVWAENIVRKTNGNVLICTPLSVVKQFLKEASKFGIEVNRSNDGKIKKGITITNYEKLHKFNSEDFVGFGGDESSILKNFKGKTKELITWFIRKMPYRFLCTATAAPNDYIELGTTAEALGQMGFMDMLHEFFANTQNDNKLRQMGENSKWRFKGHSQQKFWQWVASWSLSLRKPSDIGNFSDEKFKLPKLIENDILVECTKPLPGKLFIEPARGLYDQRKERKITLKERCERVAEICQNKDTSVIWCQYNNEGDYLSKIVDDSMEIHGRLSDDKKEEIYDAFSCGELKKLIIKPKIGAFGLNWQHCNHTIFFPSHSFEQYYQGIRRFWRFGQDNDVVVDRVSTPGEQIVLQNLKRKLKQAEEMFNSLIFYMNNSKNINNIEKFNKNIQLPSWI